jgi:hypothetical protein
MHSSTTTRAQGIAARLILCQGEATQGNEPKDCRGAGAERFHFFHEPVRLAFREKADAATGEATLKAKCTGCHTDEQAGSRVRGCTENEGRRSERHHYQRQGQYASA